jgi:ABC-type glycerol-3-phosphate transport system substrate-binding protein
MLPWYIMGTGARVNVTLAREAKIEDKLPKAPEYAWNWDQWLDFAKAVAALKNKDGKPVFGAILPTQTTVPAFHWTTFQWIWNQGGDMTKDGMGGGCAQLSSDAGVKALQFLQDLYYSHKVVPNPASIKFEDVGPYWDQSTLGYQTGIGLNNVRAKDVKGDKKSAILTAPQGHEWMLVRNPTAPGVTHQGWGGPSLDVNIAPFKQKESRKLEAIVDFGHFLVNKENQVFMAQFQVPARQSVAKEKLGDDPWVKMTLDNLVPNARGFPADDNSLKMRETFHNHYQELFIGGNPKKAREVAAEIDAEAKRIVGC